MVVSYGSLRRDRSSNGPDASLRHFPIDINIPDVKNVHLAQGDWFRICSSRLCQPLHDLTEKPQLEQGANLPITIAFRIAIGQSKNLRRQNLKASHWIHNEKNLQKYPRLTL
jgi:hypothetical protein